MLETAERKGMKVTPPWTMLLNLMLLMVLLAVSGYVIRLMAAGISPILNSGLARDARGEPAFDPKVTAAMKNDVEDDAIEPRTDGDRGGKPGNRHMDREDEADREQLRLLAVQHHAEDLHLSSVSERVQNEIAAANIVFPIIDDL